ncbi:MAG: LysE family transporter [Chloroflexi bacterium]|nr:LysE family transporter [Chloroflexota bacterium]
MEALGLLFLSSFIVGLSGAATPGPLLMVNIAEVARRGFWAAPALALGHSLLELVTVALLGLGLSQVLHTGVIPGLVGLLGGLFLLWMGGGMIRSAPRLSLRAAMADARSSPAGLPVLLGVTASLSNPYWLVWWATVGASFMVASLAWGLVGLATFYVGHIASDFAWYAFVGAVVATGRRAMTDAVYRGLLVACAVFLLALGAFFILSGIGALVGLRLIDA